MSGLVLIASCTATTAASAVETLSAKGIPVRAMCRKIDDARVTRFASLPNVTLYAGDMTSAQDVATALDGVSRVMLVSGAFSHDQFETETLFIEAAFKKGVEVIVRVSTGAFLIKAGTKGSYGRAHHGIEAFCADHKYPVVNLNPNWFLSNWFGSAGEAKATGLISYPVSGNGPKDISMIDPRDVGTAAAAILSLPSAGLQPFIAKKNIHVHGATPVNFADVAAALSRSVGYEIKVNQVPRDAWAGVLMSYGIPRVFATSFLETVEAVDGVVSPGYECYGTAEEVRKGWNLRDTSPELLALGWTPKTLEEWANDPATIAVFAK